MLPGKELLLSDKDVLVLSRDVRLEVPEDVAGEVVLVVAAVGLLEGVIVEEGVEETVLDVETGVT